MKQPKPIFVYVTVTPNKRNGLSKPFTARVGACDTITEAKKIIADDLKEMGNTYGGLIDPSDTLGRKYRVFQAQWTELKL